MKKRDITARSVQSERAIVAVLAAEKHARELIANCAVEADEILAEAQQRAQTLAERTDRRITRLRAYCDRSIRERTAALFEADTTQAGQVRDRSLDAVSMVAVVTCVAAALTAGLDENPPGPRP